MPTHRVRVGWPAPPVDLQTEVRRGRIVHLTWQPGHDGGSPIQRYDIVDNGGGVVASVDADTRSIDLPASDQALHSAVSYSVDAVNAVGSARSAMSPRIRVPAEAPGPFTLSGTPGDRRVQLSWTASAALGGRLLEYTARDGSGRVVCRTLRETECSVSGLTPDVPHTFVVRASSTEGTTESAPVTVTPFALPSAPLVHEPEMLGTTARVTWQASTGSTTPVTYTVTSTPATTTCTTTTTACEFRGLVPRTEYSFSVVASNASGSEGALETWPVRAYAAPDKPAHPSLTTYDIDRLRVTWKAPTDNGSPITEYVVTFDPDKGRTLTERVPGHLLSVDSPSLRPLMPYTVAVRAVNAGGSSEAAVVRGKHSVLDRNLFPEKSAKPTVTARQKTTVSLSWKATVTPGATPVDRYEVLVRRGSTIVQRVVVDGAARSTKITGLKMGTRYRFGLRAHNSRGWGVRSYDAETTTLR